MSVSIRSRIWIESEEGVILGEGRSALLKAIEKTGSLSKAAKELGMSYKKAWNLVDAMNRASGTQLVETNTGGHGGGGTTLTPYGKTCVQTFDTINANCWSFLDDQLREYLPSLALEMK